MTGRKFNGGMARELREETGLTIRKLAEKVQEITGRRYHDDHFRNVELGHQQPGLELSHAIAEALGVKRADLMTDAPTP